MHLDIKLDLRPIVSLYKWGITVAVEEELVHFRVEKFIKLEDAFMIPISEKELEYYRQKYSFFTEYDLADQTLMAASIRDKCPLLTDDRSQYRTARSIGVDAMLLPHFCLLLVRDGNIDKRSVRQMIKFWEKTKKFKVRTLKMVKAELQAIR